MGSQCLQANEMNAIVTLLFLRGGCGLTVPLALVLLTSKRLASINAPSLKTFISFRGLFLDS